MTEMFDNFTMSGFLQTIDKSRSQLWSKLAKYVSEMSFVPHWMQDVNFQEVIGDTIHRFHSVCIGRNANLSYFKCVHSLSEGKREHIYCIVTIDFDDHFTAIIV